VLSAQAELCNEDIQNFSFLDFGPLWSSLKGYISDDKSTSAAL
jgi:hypothetical protein